LVSGLWNENPGLPFFVTDLPILVSGLPIFITGFRNWVSGLPFLVLEPCGLGLMLLNFVRIFIARLPMLIHFRRIFIGRKWMARNFRPM